MPHNFPRLMGLDLSYNNICSIDDSIRLFKDIENLKMLSLKGNPIEILRTYRTYMLDELPNLKYFDNEKIPEEDDGTGDNIIQDFSTLMQRQYGEDYEEKVQEQMEATEKAAKGNNKKGGKKDKGGKDDNKKGGKKDNKDLKVPKKNDLKNVPTKAMLESQLTLDNVDL